MASSRWQQAPAATHVTFVIITIVAWLSVHFSAQAQTPFQAGLAWELCTRQDQCLDNYFCAQASDETFAGCSIANMESTSPSEFCNCKPLIGVGTCSSSASCAHGEICARDNVQDSQFFCVSCYALGNNTIFNFKPLSASDEACDALPTPTASPSATVSPIALPPARAFDFCYGSDCDGGMFCAQSEQQKFQCIMTSTKCVCQPDSATRCSDSSVCEEGTACVTDVREGENICVSCTAIAQQANYVPLDEAGTTCLQVTPIPGPSYPIQLNGASLDLCRSDTMCHGGRICVENISSPSTASCPEDQALSCLCSPPRGLVSCESSVDCESGLEVCGIAPSLPSLKCYSLYLAKAFGPVFAKVIGEKLMPVAESPALSGEECRFDWECAPPRRCNHLSESNRYGECAGRRACRCKPLFDKRCSGNDDCDVGEACVHIVGSRTGPVCRALSAIAADPLYELEDPESVVIPPAPSPSSGVKLPIPAALGSRLLGEPCSANADCTSQMCKHVTEDATECAGRPGCKCAPSITGLSCKTNRECEKGEVCAVVLDQIRHEVPPFCFSAALIQARPDIYVQLRLALEPLPSSPNPSIPIPSTSTSPPESTSPTSSQPPLSPSLSTSSSPSISISGQQPSPEDVTRNVCIDATALSHLHPNELIYPTHRRAAVLCDTAGSCATPGHLVVWDEIPMLMRSYCAHHATCSRHIIQVNSPRVRLNLRVKSKTTGLSNTALAAKFETSTEERLLQMLVHIGL